MSRNKDYQRLLNDRRWKQLRAAYLQLHPLCELCKEKGLVVAAVDVHHRTPVETARSLTEMEQLAYRVDNLQALCIPCHVKVHKEMRSHSREAHRKREQQRLQRWIERNKLRDGTHEQP